MAVTVSYRALGAGATAVTLVLLIGGCATSSSSRQSASSNSTTESQVSTPPQNAVSSGPTQPTTSSPTSTTETFAPTEYPRPQRQAFLDLEHNDYAYRYHHDHGSPGISDGDLLRYGAQGCHLAELPTAERIAYLGKEYLPNDELLSLRRFSIVYALQTLCPKHDFNAVMHDVNKVIWR